MLLILKYAQSNPDCNAYLQKIYVHKLTHKALQNEAFVVGMVDESKAWALLWPIV